MRRLSLVLLLVLPATVAAAPPEIAPIAPPAVAKWEVKKVAAGMVVYGAQPASTWKTHRDDFPIHVFDKGAVGVFYLPAGDKVRISITGPDGGERLVEFVADGEPGPGPKPKPPEPKPDPLKLKIAEAIKNDPAEAAAKAKSLKDLTKLYRLLSEKTFDGATTTSELTDTCRLAAEGMIDKGALKAVRLVAAEELAAILDPGKTGLDNPLADAQRKATAALFKRLAEILEGL